MEAVLYFNIQKSFKGHMKKVNDGGRWRGQ